MSSDLGEQRIDRESNRKHWPIAPRAGASPLRAWAERAGALQP